MKSGVEVGYTSFCGQSRLESRLPFPASICFTAVLAIAWFTLFCDRSLQADEVPDPSPPSATLHFDRKIAPLLTNRCLGCHDGREKKGGLDLTRSETATVGGDSGPAVVGGKLHQSELWRKVFENQMPPKRPLSDSEKEILKEWISSGAAWGTSPINPFQYTTEVRAGWDWWSLQPLKPVSLPAVKGNNWIKNGIDHFVLAELESQGLHPSPEADRRTLIRRLSFDLRGLPPHPTEVSRFMADESDDAYEKLVQEFLNSPAYGERWARHWLDLARFGESQGFERDRLRPNAWRYRDWVVLALNQDLPYYDFVRLQIAGDVVRPDNPLAVIATGFLVAAPWDEVGQAQQSAVMRAIVRQDELEDIIGTVSQTFLGLTANCARCHDHKFDPISQREYYQLSAALSGVRHGERESLTNGGREAARQRIELLDLKKSELIKRREEIELPVRQSLGKVPISDPAEKNPATHPMPEAIPEFSLPDLLSRFSSEQRLHWNDLTWRISQIESEQRLLNGGLTYAAVPRQSETTRVLARGNPATPGDTVAANGLSAVSGLPSQFGLGFETPETICRQKLAEWVVDSRNPLTPRVVVNRLWHHHFGMGIVDSPNDFGFSGGRPSHPQLLDFLASEFLLRGSSLKSMHRLIVSSATYRQSSANQPVAFAKDAENRLLWRKSTLRLDAESLRDAVLTIAEELNPTMGGPGYQDFTTFTANSQFYEMTDPIGFEFQRRSLYRTWIRSGRNSMLDVFDCPDPSTTAPKRAVTTTPLQALSLMNNSFTLRMCERISHRVHMESGNRTPEMISGMYQRILQRSATSQELASATAFVTKFGSAAFARVLLNSTEFLYID